MRITFNLDAFKNMSYECKQRNVVAPLLGVGEMYFSEQIKLQMKEMS